MPSEFPSDNEFDFSSVDELNLSMPQLAQDPVKDFDFSGVDKLLPKNKSKSITPKTPVPIASATSGGKVRSGYGVRVPPTKGASSFHRGIDISASAGTPVNPADEGEVVFAGNRKGKGLSVVIKHLDGRETEYNHLSKISVDVGDRVKKEAVIGNVGQTGIATGPHLDFRVIDEDGNYVNPFNELGTDPRESGTDLELKSKYDPKDFDFTQVDQELNITGAKDNSVQATDPSKIDFQVGTKKVPALLHWMAQNNKPKILANNPYDVGEPIKTQLDWSAKYKSGRTARPDVNVITDTWLRAWNPEYEQLNKKFREETGGLNIALVDQEANLNYKGRGLYEIAARPSRGVKALLESYKKDGLPGFNATNKLINEQIDKLEIDYAETKKNLDEQIAKKPYLNAMISGAERGVGSYVTTGIALKYLTKALAIGNIKGYNSQEYLDLINAETKERESLGSLEESIYRPPTFAGKVIAGATEGLVTLPKYVLAGKISPAGLPVMTYLDNLHRGNREAAMAALPMALMVGSMHGAGEFLSGRSLVNKNVVGEDGNLVNKTFYEASPGTSAPFRRIPAVAGKFTKEDLSLFTERLAQGQSTSISNLSPLARQVLLRGSNAVLLAGSSYVTDPSQSVQDIAANLVVGLTFPVGKSPKESSNFIIPPISESISETNRVKIPLQLGPARINFPTEEIKPTIYGGRENPSIFLPSGEVGSNKYSEQFKADIETGFEARTEPQNIQLSVDTAALNLIDLRRSLKNGSYKNEGDAFDAILLKQQAIQDAINVYEKVLDPETIKFFEENETPIREALRGNWEANKASAEAKLGAIQKTFEESGYTPSDVSPIRINEPVYKDGKLREDVGKQNVLGTNREPAEKIIGNFFKVTENKNTLQSSIIPYGDVIAKKINDLGYLTAFFMEDYYHRGIEPKIDVIANRLRDALGKFGEKLTDDNIKAAYKAGADYLNSNAADPFFSRMKQDALEKLPNRMDVEQARNILNQHKTELEWTSGLEDFLAANEGKKISKQELIDVIQKGQVRVAESVAERQTKDRIDEINDEIGELNRQRYNRASAGEEQEAHNLNIRIGELLQEQDKLVGLPDTRYSLRDYTGEKLELAGAKNSKEVKLISPPMHSARFLMENRDVPVDMAKYKSPHWDEGNIVAHYRSNDRITTDNQRVYFGEEFQSDWNHDARVRGVKLNAVEEARYKELSNKLGNEEIPTTNRLTEEEKTEFRNLNDRKNPRWSSESPVEPNPFMQHNWKELVLKRFLRDAAIAKDENGNYKYDGVGWTTARQQLERYGGILEGKEFKWRKNSDGTYSFDLKPSTDMDFRNDIHELQNISLERFAELTTPEAAQEVRDQEAAYKAKLDPSKGVGTFRGYDERGNILLTEENPSGQFSLKEAVELRGGKEGKYADYDIAYKNILSKIGKRFGARYSEKEISVGADTKITFEKFLNSRGYTFEQWQEAFNKEVPEKWAEDISREHTNLEDIQKIHYLEITPSMRQSLEREGFSLYGLGKSEPLKSTETGIRNRVTTREAFDQHRNELVKSIEDFVAPVDRRTEERIAIEDQINSAKSVDDLEAMRVEIEARRKMLDNTFNSGLNPDALIDQFKLLYRGIKDFEEFSSRVLKRFGEQIKPFLQDLWIQVKGIQEAAANSFDDLADYLQKGKDSAIFKSRKFDEGGFIGIGTKASQALKDYKQNKQREGVFRVIPPKLWRAIGLAQADRDFGEIHNVMRRGQRARNSFESNVLSDLKAANDKLKGTDPHAVAEIIFQGNEQEKVFSASELAAKGLSPEQIEGYNYIRKASDLNLEWRKQHVLYNMRERADRLNDRLLTKTPGTPEHDAILAQMIDLSSAMNDVTNHFDHLKNTGYISLVRMGKIVALAKDAAGDLLYNHFDSDKEANAWVLDKEASGATGAKIYDFKKPEDLRQAATKLTPGQFEDLVDQASVNPNSPEIEALRDEVYSRYPSFKYQLKRDFTAGYDRNWKFVLESIANQTEIYANSFYARVAGNEALKKLSDVDLYNKNYEMYEIAKKYIDDEISSQEQNAASKVFGGARKAVYLINLGYDINQLYLNAIAQPITQTYSYFARVEHNGIKLGRGAAEKYFVKGADLVNRLAAKALGAKVNVDPDFEAIYNRLRQEKVIEPEFNKDLLLMESEKSVQSQLAQATGGFFSWRKQQHWASVFMRAGEKTTRSHVAAEAFLVGKEKFGLAGEELVDFMVRAIDATQSNPSKGEAPWYVRNFGEAGKLAYQFNTFNHMWMENLALNVRSDFKNMRVSATVRHLAPLILMGGIRGLPLAGFSFALYTLITGDDLKKKYFDKWFKNHENLERLALYGVTTSPSISQKVTPSNAMITGVGIGASVGSKFGGVGAVIGAGIGGGISLLDTGRIEDNIYDTAAETFASSTIPALSTAGQILRGFDDLFAEGQFNRGLAEISPRFLRGPQVAARYDDEGVRTRSGNVIVHKNKLSTADIAGQFFNITPTKVSEFYEEKKQEKLKEINKRIRRRLRRIL